MKTTKQIREEIAKSNKLTDSVAFKSDRPIRVGRRYSQIAIRFALQWVLDNKYDKSIVEYVDESFT